MTHDDDPRDRSGSEPEQALGDEASVPTMAEVLDAPSPRRAAREAAAREAALREAAEHAERKDAPEPEPEPERPTLVAPAAVAPAAVASAPVASEPVASEPVASKPVASKPVAPDPVAPEAQPADAVGRDASAPRRVPTRTEHADLTLDVEALFGATREPDAPSADRPADSAADARPAVAPALDEVPAVEWAESLRRASSEAEAAAASAPSVPAETGATRSGPSMSVVQKVLFVVLALVIVAGVVALVVLLTSPGASAASAQPISISYGSVSTSSITPPSISSGRNG